MLILDLPLCNGPLGMENGKISDSQITASSFLSPTNEPTEARFRHSGSWCPAKPQKVIKNESTHKDHHILYRYTYIVLFWIRYTQLISEGTPYSLYSYQT